MLHMDNWNVYTHLCERPGVFWSPERIGCRSGYTTALGHFYSGNQVLSWRPCSSLMPRCRGSCHVLIEPQGGVSDQPTSGGDCVSSLSVWQEDQEELSVSLFCLPKGCGISGPLDFAAFLLILTQPFLFKKEVTVLPVLTSDFSPDTSVLSLKGSNIREPLFFPRRTISSSSWC